MDAERFACVSCGDPGPWMPGELKCRQVSLCNKCRGQVDEGWQNPTTEAMLQRTVAALMARRRLASKIHLPLQQRLEIRAEWVRRTRQLKEMRRDKLAREALAFTMVQR